MKRIWVFVLMFVLIASVSYGAVTATRISGNTVSFSTVASGALVTPNIVTFNTTSTRIRFINLSKVADCYIDLRCVDANGKSGKMTRSSATLLVPAVGNASPNTVEIDFATRNIGFAGDTIQTSSNGTVDASNQRIHYDVIGETGSF